MPAKPQPMEVLAQNIPPTIQKAKTWVGWKWVLKPGKNGQPDEWTKPPFNIENSHKASSTNPSTWTHFNRAINAYLDGKVDGIGRVIRPPFVGIDLDKCRDRDTGSIEPWAQEIISKFKSYTETSPSGTGVKIWIEGKIPGKRRRQDKIEFYDGKTIDGKDGGRYFTVTGQHLESTPYNVEKRQKELDELYNELFPEQEMGANAPTEPKSPRILHGIDDQQIIEKALDAKDGGKFRQLWDGDISGYPSPSEADQALCNKLAFWLGADFNRIDSQFRRSGLNRKKWTDREDYRTRTIEKAVSQTTETYKPSCTQNQAIGESIPIEPSKIKNLEFPSWVMAGVAGDFADLYSTCLEPPKHFFWLAFNTCLGSVLTDKVQLPSEISPETRIYSLLLGQSADERKSTAIEKTVEFFRWAIDGFYTCWGVGSAEGLQERLKRHRTLLLCFDEFRQFTSKSKIEGSILLECVNTLFESNRFEANTKKSHVLIEDAHVSMLAASTIDTYENTWSSHFSDIGFTNRLFVCPGKAAKQFSLPPRVPESEKTMLRYRLGEILRHAGNGLELEFEPQAKELYHQWYMNLDRSIHAKRLDGYALRFMILLAVNQLKNVVDEETVNQAMALCDWQLHARKLHDPIDADNAVAKMEEKIRRILDACGILKDYELKQKVNANRAGLKVYQYAIQNLKAAQEIGWKNKTKEVWLRNDS